MPKRRTNEEFYDDMKRIHPDFVITGEYYNCNTVVHVKDLMCGYEWDTKAGILYYHGCPKCGNSIKKTEEEFIKELADRGIKAEYISGYDNRNSEILVRCKICGYEFTTTPKKLLNQKCGCPICASKKVVRGINDISTTAPEILPYFVNIEDAYSHTCNSHAKIKVKCPDCGYEKEMIIKNLYIEGFGCPVCNDGISYPNKFARSFIKQLPVNKYIFEYSPDWIGKKRFDIYFEYMGIKYIIEMDGDFHYKDGGFHENNYLINITNDNYKENLALLHGIEVIRIESRKSDIDYLRKNICNSKLGQIFDLSYIDWRKCEAEAISNICKDVCLYYQDHKFDEDSNIIAEHFHIHISTYQRYLRTGKRLGWLNETEEEEDLVRAIHLKSKRGIGVSLFNSNGYHIRDFNSLLACEKYIRYFYNTIVYRDKISKYVKNNNVLEWKGFTFKPIIHNEQQNINIFINNK